MKKKMDTVLNNIELFTEAIQSSQQSAVEATHLRATSSIYENEVKVKTPPRFILVKKDKADEKECTETKTRTGRFSFQRLPNS